MSETQSIADKISDIFVARLRADQEAWSTAYQTIALSMRSFCYDSYVKPWIMSTQPKKVEPSVLLMALIGRAMVLAKESKQ